MRCRKPILEGIAVGQCSISMDKIRVDEKAVFEKSSSETTQALEEVKAALKVMSEP